MEGESGGTRSIIDSLPYLDIHGGQIYGGSGVTQSVIDKPHSWDIQGDQMEGQSGVTRSIIYEFHYPISNEIKWKVKVVLLEVLLMNLILWIWSNER